MDISILLIHTANIIGSMELFESKTLPRAQTLGKPVQLVCTLYNVKLFTSPTQFFQEICIPAKLLHNRDIVSVHFNYFYCMGICDKLSRHLSMLTYIYLNVDDC